MTESNTPLEQLDDRIKKLVEAGIFSSEEQALDAIFQWLRELEENFFIQQMHEQDA